MREVFLLKRSALGEGDRRVVLAGDLEIGVFRRNGAFYAYRNLCAHQGGPACEGLLMAKVEEVIAPDKTYQGMRFNHDEIHIVCPWHGYEYDLTTGECVGDRRLRLTKYQVVERGDDLYALV
jgi:nitrite reductase/ring-hydroxylating ferredoxin subunit